MKNIPQSFRILYTIFGVVFAIIIVKLYILAVARHEYYNKLSVANTIKTEILIPTRGQMLDRNNEPLAINELGFTLSLRNRLSKEELERNINFIAAHIIDVDAEELLKTYQKFNSMYRRTPVTLIDFVSYAQMQIIYPAMIQEKNIIITPTTKRYYPNNSSAAHVIGYIGAMCVIEKMIAFHDIQKLLVNKVSKSNTMNFCKDNLVKKSYK